MPEHIFKRGRKHVVKIGLGKDPATGKRRYYWKSHDTEAEAIRDRARVLTELAHGEYRAPDQTSLGEYLDTWHKLRADLGQVEGSTSYHQASHLRQIKRHIGAVTLGELDVEHVEALHQGLLDDGLARTTIRTVHSILTGALNDALARKRIRANPATLVPPPKRPSRRRPPRWSDEEIRRFLEAVDARDDGLFWRVMLMTAMRIGEQLALRWQNVETQTVNGQRTTRIYVRDNRKLDEFGHPTVGQPKRPESYRGIVLAPETARRLAQHRIAQNKLRLTRGGLWQDHDYVFPSEFGTLGSYENHLTRFHRIREEAGLPHATPHTLRHTAASLMIRRGVNIKVVSEILGHTSVRTTMDMYVEVWEEQQAEATTALERMFDDLEDDGLQAVEGL